MGDLEMEDKVGGVVLMGAEARAVEGEDEEERLLGEMDVLDFDMLCSTVAMQSQGKWRLFENEWGEEGGGGGGDFGGVFRMWEGEVLDCFQDHRIAIESACCPCYRFGKNMRRAGLGSCFLQGMLHMILLVLAVLNCIAFTVTRRHYFLYLGIAFSVSLGTYLGFSRTQMKKKFNIRGNDSPLDDCIYHLICPCCTISQESRTLEMNNVQDGTWHGRGDMICIGRQIFELHPPPLPVIPKPGDPLENAKDIVMNVESRCPSLSRDQEMYHV